MVLHVSRKQLRRIFINKDYQLVEFPKNAIKTAKYNL